MSSPKAIMRFRDILILVLAGAVLTGFGGQKAEVLVQKCAERGSSEAECRCILDVQEQALGPEFIEALYFQAIGDLTTYEMKLFEVVKNNPEILSLNMAELQTRANQQCRQRQ